MTLTLDHDKIERDVVPRPVPAFRPHALMTTAGAAGSEPAAKRPVARILLLCLGGWAAGAFTLAAAAALWPLSAPTPAPQGSQIPSHGEDYGAITARPLFARTRHRAAVPVFVPPPPPPRDRDIRLKGVFLNGSDARAFLTASAEAQGRWLAMNDTIAGWTIVSLTSEEVRLSAAGETLSVPLHPVGPGGGALPPRAAMPMLPRPVPSPVFPANGGALEPGLRPDAQGMNGAAMPGLLGMGARPAATAP